jgi:hypothetical protein
MKTSIDIARELLLIWTSGTHGDGAIAELRRRFPQATTAELQRACHIRADQIDLCLENEEKRREDASKAFYQMVSGAPEDEIDAAIERLKCTPDNLFSGEVANRCVVNQDLSLQ